MDPGDRRGARPSRLDWRDRIAAYLLSTVAAGIAINLLSDHGLPVLGAATGLAAVFGIAAGLNRYPGSALQHAARILLWSIAGVCSLASMFTSRGWSIALVAVAAALLAITVLLAVDVRTAMTLIAGAGFVGAGVAGVAFGTAVAAGADVLAGLAAVGVGVGGVMTGLALLRASRALFGGAFLLEGLASAVWGVSLLRDGAPVIGAPIVGIGVGFAALGRLMLLRGNATRRPAAARRPAGAVVIAAGLTMAAFAVVILWAGDILGGVGFLGLGLAGATFGLAFARQSGVLGGVAVLGAGVSAVVAALAVFREFGALIGVATLAAGISGVAFGAAILRQAGAWQRLTGWWTQVTADTRPTGQPVTPEPPESDSDAPS